jgi:hypothetical protein
MSKSVLNPDRIRKINGSFAFVEHRFLQDGFFESLDKAELQLYFFLVLVGNRAGVSWYSYDRICTMLRIVLDEYIDARNGLIDKDLIAFDGRIYQVLSLPDRPVVSESHLLTTSEDMELHDPATVRRIVEKSLGVES